MAKNKLVIKKVILLLRQPYIYIYIPANLLFASGGNRSHSVDWLDSGLFTHNVTSLLYYFRISYAIRMKLLTCNLTYSLHGYIRLCTVIRGSNCCGQLGNLNEVQMCMTQFLTPQMNSSLSYFSFNIVSKRGQGYQSYSVPKLQFFSSNYSNSLHIKVL